MAFRRKRKSSKGYQAWLYGEIAHIKMNEDAEVQAFIPYGEPANENGDVLQPGALDDWLKNSEATKDDHESKHSERE